MSKLDDDVRNMPGNIRASLPKHLQERVTAVFYERGEGLEEGDKGSWWSWLGAGWSSEMDPGNLHTDHERTKSALLERIRNAVPCECDECLSEIERIKQESK